MVAEYVIDIEGDKDKPYKLLEPICYYSPRYKKYILCEEGMRSDGATGAFDIFSNGWWVHDRLCNTGTFSDGSKCTTWQASMVLYDVLRSEGRWFRARSWFLPTLFLGGGETRKHNSKFRKRRGPRR